MPQQAEYRPEGVAPAKLLVALALLAILGGGIWWLMRGAPLLTADPDGELARALEGVVAPDLSGTVLGVEIDTIRLDVPQVRGVAVPEDVGLRVRRVHIAFNAPIVERRDKTREELQRERQLTGNPLALPYATTELTFADIQPGDVIRVGAGGADIARAPEITATDITRLTPRIPF